MLDAVIISYQKSVSHILQEYKGCKNEQKKEKKKNYMRRQNGKHVAHETHVTIEARCTHLVTVFSGVHLLKGIRDPLPFLNYL